MLGINEETLSNIWTLIHLSSRKASEIEAAEIFFSEDSKKIAEL